MDIIISLWGSSAWHCRQVYEQVNQCVKDPLQLRVVYGEALWLPPGSMTSRLGLCHADESLANEEETAVHGCHNRGDMKVRMYI